MDSAGRGDVPIVDSRVPQKASSTVSSRAVAVTCTARMMAKIMMMRPREKTAARPSFWRAEICTFQRRLRGMAMTRGRELGCGGEKVGGEMGETDS